MRKFVALGAAATLAACNQVEVVEVEAPVIGSAKLMREDAHVGMVTLVQAEADAKMSLRVKGLDAGEYGMHIHAVGKCDGPDYKSAGGHWNPAGKKHGLANPDGAHAGDLPNLVVLTGEETKLDITLDDLLITGENGMLDADGAAFVIHAGSDDMKTDPSGDSGERIICGVFEMG